MADPLDQEVGTPRWVKVGAVIAILVLMLIVVVLLTGNHGPARHASPGGAPHDIAHG